MKGIDRICSCHFKDGNKVNGPTLFEWNKSKLFQFTDPEDTSRPSRYRLNVQILSLQKNKIRYTNKYGNNTSNIENYMWNLIFNLSDLELPSQNKRQMWHPTIHQHQRNPGKVLQMITHTATSVHQGYAATRLPACLSNWTSWKLMSGKWLRKSKTLKREPQPSRLTT